MSLSAEERQKGIQPQDNFPVWSEMIKDYILCLDCEDAEAIWASAWWDRAAVMKIAQAAADEAGEGAVPDPVEDPVDYYDNRLGRATPRHSPTFAARCHLLSSRRLPDIKPTCRGCFGC